MLGHCQRLLMGAAHAGLQLGRGDVKSSWETLQDEFKAATLSLIHGVPCKPRFPRPKLHIPAEPLLPEHVYVVIDNGYVSLGPQEITCETYLRRLRTYGVFLSIASAAAPDVSGEFVLALGDRHFLRPLNRRPTLVFNRLPNSRRGVVLVPNADFVRTRGHAYRRRKIDRALVPWEQRVPQAVWRGSSTGPGMKAVAEGNLNPRIELCRTGTNLQHLTNFRVSRLVQGHEEQQSLLAEEGLLGEVLTPEQQVNYRWQVSIDGNASEWEGMFWKLYSGSAVLMVESKWEQWYSSLLQPWEHFVPVTADLSDLPERLQWCRDNDKECKAIGIRARELMRTEVTYRRSVDYVIEALRGGTQQMRRVA